MSTEYEPIPLMPIDVANGGVPKWSIGQENLFDFQTEGSRLKDDRGELVIAVELGELRADRLLGCIRGSQARAFEAGWNAYEKKAIHRWEPPETVDQPEVIEGLRKKCGNLDLAYQQMEDENNKLRLKNGEINKECRRQKNLAQHRVTLLIASVKEAAQMRENFLQEREKVASMIENAAAQPPVDTSDLVAELRAQVATLKARDRYLQGMIDAHASTIQVLSWSKQAKSEAAS